MSIRRAAFGSLWVIALVTASGCVTESTEGSTSKFSYELWIPLSIFFGGVVAAPAGWVLRSWSGRVGWGLLVGGPLAALFFAPSMFLERVIVTENGFSSRGGIWGATVSHDVEFKEIRSVRLTSEQSTGRRGRKKTNYYMICEKSDGTSAKVALGNDVAEAAAVRILMILSERGIPIVDQT